MKPAVGRTLAASIWLLVLSSASVQSQPYSETLDLWHSKGGDDFRTRQVQKYFQGVGRTFEIHRLPLSGDPAADYHLDRESAGNRRYSALKVSDTLFYRAVANSVRDHFVPLGDSVNDDGSGVTATEWLQILFRQAHALERMGTDLENVDQHVTFTYAWDGQHLVAAPTTFDYVDHARNAEGSELHKNFGVNAFSKHYLLSLILNDEAKVSMAGKLYLRVMALHPEDEVDLDHVFANGGEVDTTRYDFELTVTNESGTFKPAGSGLPAFAQRLVNALGLDFLHWRAHAPEGQKADRGTVTPAKHQGS